MFIRKKSKKATDKKSYVQHQLIESVRTASGPRQQIVLNLGHLNLPAEKWKELANCIERCLTNQKSLFPQDPEIEAKARHYASQIRQERLARAQGAGNTVSAEKEDAHYETVDMNSLVTNDAKTIGAEHVAMSQMDEYGFDSILQGLHFSEEHITYARMLIAGRMVHPGSERETARWLRETSGAEELLGSRVKLYDTALHRTAVLLWENHEAIEQELSRRERELFSLKETVIFYDLTNTYFEGSKRGSKVARYGKSKERRNDCPLITLSLTIDEDGFPKQSKVWEGNVSEPKTLEHILSGLKKQRGLFPKERTIVMDAGIATQENIALIKKSGYSYVAVSRKRAYDESFWPEGEAEKITLSDGKTTLGMKLVRTGEEAFLLCQSEAKEVDIRFGKNELYRTKEAAIGTYVLRTNRLDLCGEEISKLHRSLVTLEKSFEDMKGDLGLRPNFHQGDIPTIAHVHVTVLAYHMLAGILKKLSAAGIHYTWDTVRNILATHMRITTTMNTEDGHVIDVRTCTTPTEKQHLIYSKLHIKHTPLDRKYMKSSVKTRRCSAEN